jgi:RNA polymerase sigma-70 factor (ECF subfamily)
MKLDKNYSKTDRFESIHFIPIEKEIDTSVQENVKYLKECISTLNETDTSLIVLYLDDLSYKEIEVITGLTENHIAVKMVTIQGARSPVSLKIRIFSRDFLRTLG